MDQLDLVDLSQEALGKGAMSVPEADDYPLSRFFLKELDFAQWSQRDNGTHLALRSPQDDFDNHQTRPYNLHKHRLL